MLTELNLRGYLIASKALSKQRIVCTHWKMIEMESQIYPEFVDVT